MSKLVVVGLCGFKRHGKDTAANALIENHNFKRVAFADGLKSTLALALRVDRKFFEDDTLKDTVHEPSGKTYREWMQIAGTNWFRTMWGAVWVNWWRMEVLFNCASFNEMRVVVPDLRFPNELDAIRDVTSFNLAYQIHDPRKPEPTDPHESEYWANKLNVDGVLQNDSTVEALHAKIEGRFDERFGGSQA